MENIFFLKGKIIGQTSNQFTIIKFKRFNVCLMTKENNLLLFTLSHANYLSQMWQTFLSSLYFLLHAQLSLSLSLPWMSSFSGTRYATTIFLLL